MKRETEDHVVEYKDDQETKDKLFNKLIEYFFEYESFSGDCISQSDKPQINATELLCTIADDIISFKTEYKD